MTMVTKPNQKWTNWCLIQDYYWCFFNWC